MQVVNDVNKWTIDIPCWYKITRYGTSVYIFIRSESIFSRECKERFFNHHIFLLKFIHPIILWVLRQKSFNKGKQKIKIWQKEKLTPNFSSTLPIMMQYGRIRLFNWFKRVYRLLFQNTCILNYKIKECLLFCSQHNLCIII